MELHDDAERLVGYPRALWPYPAPQAALDAAAIIRSAKLDRADIARFYLQLRATNLRTYACAIRQALKLT